MASSLTIEQVKLELSQLTNVENGTGFLYFCENFVKVSHPGGKAIAFKDNMFNWQEKAAVEFVQNINVISLKQRQVGFSTLVAAYCLWRALFFEGQYISIVSLTQRESTEFLRRTKFIYDHLPPWLKQSTSEFAKTSIEFAHNGSKIHSLPNNTDPARGSSASLIVADEFAMFKDAKSFLAAAVPALSAGINIPFTNRTLPSQLFIISTLPNNPLDNEYLRLLHNAQDDADSKFHLITVDTKDIPQYQDPEWHKRMRESLGERIYKIEILAQEVYDIENSLVASHTLERLDPESPIRTDFLLPDSVDTEGYLKDFNKMLLLKENFDKDYNYIKGLWIWEDPIEGADYILCCDAATGHGGDFSAIQVIRLEDLTQVAEFKGKPDIEQFKQIMEIVANYYNHAKLSIERTGLGEAIVSYFSDTLMYEGLYFHQKAKHTLEAGFPMSTAVRGTAISLFASMMAKYEIKLKSVRSINEVRSFGYTKTGRIEGIGNNDDLVMCLVQFAYLNHIGFAVSSSTALQNNLIFGQLISKEVEKPKEEKEKCKSVKYWEQYFDVDIEDEETLEFIKMTEAAGLAVPYDEMKRFIQR